MMNAYFRNRRKSLLTGLAVIGVAAILTGCGGGDYAAYTSAKMRQAELEQGEKPLLSMSYTDSGGKPVTMVINLPKERMEIEQQRANEWAGVVGGIASTVAPWIGVGMVAGEMADMGGGGNSTTINSGVMARDTLTNSGEGVMTVTGNNTTTQTTTQTAAP